MVTAADRERRSLADQADHAAGIAFRAGDYVKAARLIVTARAADPARGGLWAERSVRIQQATREAAGRVASTQEEYRALPGIVSDRLTAAGVAADSPELEFLREWNAAAAERREARETAGPVGAKVENVPARYWQMEREIRDELRQQARAGGRQAEAGQ
jgi:hypothetical protein